MMTTMYEKTERFFFLGPLAEVKIVKKLTGPPLCN